MEIVSVKGAKDIDQTSINEVGIPAIVLMENAAQEIYSAILHKGKKFLVFCGEGNNGGDGLAIARKLILADKQVVIIICGQSGRQTEEFKINYNILKKMNANIKIVSDLIDINEEFFSGILDADVVVDCIFGIGLSRKIDGIYYKIIEGINKFSKYTIAVDIPSGLNGDNGNVQGICVRANETYTVEVYKKGFFIGEASEYIGDLNIIKIGFPKEVVNKFSENIRTLTTEEYKQIIPIRKKNSHKGNYGKVVILAGSKGYSGAAFIATEAAVRCGSGLVTLVVNKDIENVLSSRLIEAMIVNYNETDKINKLIKEATVIACGPGLGKSDESKSILKKFIINSKCPIVLDADAINIISEYRYLLSYIKGRAVLTPHPGEMARLCEKNIDTIEANRINECIEFCKKEEVITLLKGYNTVISDGIQTVINTSGNSKMASGGMGDCLTGIITSLIGQGINIFNATILGCYIHGLAGDILSKERYSVNARDIIKEIPKILDYIVKI